MDIAYRPPAFSRSFARTLDTKSRANDTQVYDGVTSLTRECSESRPPLRQGARVGGPTIFILKDDYIVIY